MKKIIVALICLFSLGCSDNLSPRDNLSPKLEQDINGQIQRLENNQNSMRAEIDRISLINKENNNSGIQILQGDGGLIFLFGLITIFLVIFYFYKVAEGERKTSEILAEQIVKHQDETLESNVIKAAEYTNVEQKICHLINSKKNNIIKPKDEPAS